MVRLSSPGVRPAPIVLVVESRSRSIIASAGGGGVKGATSSESSLIIWAVQRPVPL